MLRASQSTSLLLAEAQQEKEDIGQHRASRSGVNAHVDTKRPRAKPEVNSNGLYRPGLDNCLVNGWTGGSILSTRPGESHGAVRSQWTSPRVWVDLSL